jgi:hypothetical protein
LSGEVCGLRERDVDDRGLAANFGVMDGKEGGPYLGTAEEIKMERNSVRLVVRRECAVEVRECDPQD